MVRQTSASCPRCYQTCRIVRKTTMQHHLRFPLSKARFDDAHYYCRHFSCEIAYFSDTTHYLTSQLQTSSQLQQKMVCFCFGISASAFQEYIVRHGKRAFFDELDTLAHTSECLCRVKNPSGQGCLKVFKSMADQ